MGTQEVVEADVLVSCYIDHLRNRDAFRSEVTHPHSSTQTHFFSIGSQAYASSAYRLVGDDQLDDRQSVEHGDGSNVPGEKTVITLSYITSVFTAPY